MEYMLSRTEISESKATVEFGACYDRTEFSLSEGLAAIAALQNGWAMRKVSDMDTYLADLLAGGLNLRFRITEV